MSDEGEKTCPLCAEEMDLTDQQLKPCKCGYEICVWCWHHIMDMAEKDQSEGRCPACRTPYNKEKVVGPGANCGRLVSEVNTEKKQRSQKGKSKTIEGRNKLGSVRVIQRNLVYVVGLPLDFADEDLLQGRDYFNQYGKVMKVSISRTSAGAIQQFANSTCSVYITYSKEEEAVRCIQSVHGFVLDGRPLKACFGTTKYCHAWLRNMPCSNPDCLYLHEVGTQEDSFTKDEIISAYTRNRVQYITGSSYPTNRRSGNVLPAPADEYCNTSSVSLGKPTPKSATNTNTVLQQNPTVPARVSPPSSSSGRSTALPAGASWGARPSSSQPLPTSTPYSNGPVKQKPDTGNIPVALSTAVVNPSQISSSHIDIPKKLVPNEGNTTAHDKSQLETSGPIKKEESDGEARVTVSESSFPSIQFSSMPLNKQTHISPIVEPLSKTIHKVDASSMSNETASDVYINSRDGNLESIRSGIFSVNTHETKQLQNGHVEAIQEPAALQRVTTATISTDFSVADVQSESRMGVSTTNNLDSSEMEDDLLSFHSQRIKDPEVATDKVADYARNFHVSKHSVHSPSFNMGDGLNSVNMDRQVVDKNTNSTVPMSNFPMGHPDNLFNGALVNDVGYSKFFPYKDRNSMPHPSDGQVTSETLGVGESSIISNILSLDLNSWDDSLTSPHNLSKLWGETDKQGSFGVPGPRKIQNSNQSRFSFAREQEPVNQTSNFGHSVNNLDQVFRQHPFGNDFSGGSSLNFDNFVSHGGFPSVNSIESDIFASNHSHISSNKNSVSRSQISAPPGFSVPSRAPPPGFTSHDRTDQICNSFSANHIHDASSLLRNQYQTYSSGNSFNNDDIEFMDPAILEVGKGILAGGLNNSGVLDMRSSYIPQSSTYEEARFQSLLQRSLPQHQNQRFSHNGDMFSQLGDAYGIPSHTSLNRQSPHSQFSHPQSRNGQWDAWNEIQGGSNLGIAELLRSERMGFNNNFGGYEDSKLRMPSSGNLYNGTYGI